MDLNVDNDLRRNTKPYDHYPCSPTTSRRAPRGRQRQYKRHARPKAAGFDVLPLDTADR